MALPGPDPKITFDQYKEILKIKKEKRGERPKRGTLELTYAKLGGKFGLRPHTIVNAAKRGIKRYDIRIWKEEQEARKALLDTKPTKLLIQPMYKDAAMELLSETFPDLYAESNEN